MNRVINAFTPLIIIMGALISLFVSTAADSIARSGPPYALGQNHRVLDVFTPDDPDERQYKNQLARFLEMLPEENAVIIAEDVFSLGLRLYDPDGYYAGYPLVSGSYLSKEDFIGDTGRILAKDGLYPHRIGLQNGGDINLTGAEQHIVGVIGRDHPLYSNDHTIIQSFFDAFTLEGTYYIDAEDDGIGDIVGFFSYYGYEVSIEEPYDASPMKYWNAYSQSFGRLITAFGVVFSIAGLGFYCALRHKRSVKTARIHYLCGGRTYSILKTNTISTVIPTLLGSAVGGSLMGTYLAQVYREISNVTRIGVLGASVLINTCLFLAIYMSTYIAGRRIMKLGG